MDNNDNKFDYSQMYSRNGQAQAQDWQARTEQLSPDEEQKRRELAAKGRKAVIAVTVLTGIGSLVALLAASGLLIILPIVLCVFLLKGKNWARIILGGVYAIVALSILAPGIVITWGEFNAGGSYAWSILFSFAALVIVPGAFAYLLLLSKYVKAYCGKYNT